jgi:hypothetical protein
MAGINQDYPGSRELDCFRSGDPPNWCSLTCREINPGLLLPGHPPEWTIDEGIFSGSANHAPEKSLFLLWKHDDDQTI